MPSLCKKPQSVPLIHINRREKGGENLCECRYFCFRQFSPQRCVWVERGHLSSSSLLCKLLETQSDGLSPKQLAVHISCFFFFFFLPFKPGTMASAWGRTRSWPCPTSTSVLCSRRCTWSRWCLYCPNSSGCRKSSKSPKFSRTRSTPRT